MRDAQIEEADKQMALDEEQVFGNVANTLPGVVARLILLIPSVDGSRWADRGLMEQGFLALYREMENLDYHAQQIACAAHDLIDIEWRQNLAAYEKSASDFAAILKLRAMLEDQGVTPAVEAKLDDLEERLSNRAEIRRVVQTLAPDHEAYQRKTLMLLAENVTDDIVPWLARDTAYLAGRIERPASEYGADQ